MPVAPGVRYGDLTAQQRLARFNAFRNAQFAQQQLVQQGTNLSVAFTVDQVLTNTMRGATGQTLQAVAGITSAYRRLIRANKGAFLKLWRDVGDRAIIDTVNAYEDKKTGQGGRGGGRSQSYRSNAPEPYRRDAGGKLRAALESKAMYQATSDGILWVNKTHLDINARQWYRLNFGAGPRAGTGRAHQAKHITFYGKKAGNLSLREYRPSPGFLIPASIWSTTGDPGDAVPSNAGRRGQDQLVPTGLLALQSSRLRGKDVSKGNIRSRLLSAGGEGLWFESKGIASQAFLDRGLGTIAHMGPDRLEGIFAELAQEALTNTSSTSAREFSKAGVSAAGLAAILKPHEARINDFERYKRQLQAPGSNQFGIRTR